MAKLDVKVESDARAYRVLIDHRAVKLTDGEGQSADLPAGQHTMTWDIVGKAGDYLTIEVGQDGELVLKADKSTIPAGEGLAHGVATVTVR